MPQPQAASTLRKTPNFDFIFGRYSQSKVRIPYLQISMSFSDAAEHLRLVSEMPGAAAMDWKIEELFQRDIDWQRVEKKIVPYLRQANQPQFFNSLTIALLPIHGEEIKTFADELPWNAPVLENGDQFKQGKTCSFGPITCGYWGSWQQPTEDTARLGQVCWNTREVCGIAIDGQHRLAAIKSIISPGSDPYAGTSVPVILVILDKRLGYTGNSGRDGIIETLRQLFIDLNKHAKTVKRARQILLDDKDPASVCVRTLVGKSLQRGSDELVTTPPRMPLSLVDWHSEQALFDKGPYVSTILGADWIVARALGIRPFQDMMAFDEIDAQIGRLEQKLGISLAESTRRLEDCRKYERPFVFSEEPDELGLIADGFAREWASPLVHLLSQFKPYESLISLRRKLGTLSPEFASWNSLRQQAEDAKGAGKAKELFDDFMGHLSGRETDPIAPSDFENAMKACSELKAKNGLAFTVVFQRALVLAFLQYAKIKQRMIDELGSTEDIDIEEVLESTQDDDNNGGDHTALERRAREFIAALNHLVGKEPDVLKKEFEFPTGTKSEHDRLWLCSFVIPEGSIDFTQGASKRGSDLLLLAALFAIYRDKCELRARDFEKILEKVSEPGPGLDNKLEQCFSRMYLPEGSIAHRITASRELEVDDEALRREQVTKRAAWLWSRMTTR